MMTSKVLLVDDEAGFLSAYKRDLGKHFDIRTALGGRQGLDVLNRKGHFAVVVSDLLMPGMNGIRFLDEAKKRFPDTVRIMLTGHADLSAAMDAVNEGNVFRFHTKPCSLVDLVKTIKEGIEQHQHQMAIASENRQLTAERVQIDRDLRVARKQGESASRLRSELFANISHELRTPLTHVIGFSELLTTQVLDAEKYQQYAEYIFSSGTHLLEMIENVLTLSRINSGEIELNDEHLLITDLVTACVAVWKECAKISGVSLEKRIPKDLPYLVADINLFRQILMNLISNGIKYSKPGDTVIVAATAQIDHGLTIQVIDTGIGIAAEDMERAMAPFGQVDAGLDRKFEGLGIGLPMAKAIAQLYGGTLTVQSEVDVGTTVTVNLPSERVIWSKMVADRRRGNSRDRG